MKIVTELAKYLGINNDKLKVLVIDAPKKYKVYKIPKRTTGYRIIAQPTKEIKDIQRATVKILEQYLQIHSCAFAYRATLSIKDNAEIHKGNDYFLKMDFSNFFNSITPEMLLLEIRKFYNISTIEFNILKRILFWCPSKRTKGALVLSIGAPSSPFISNAICYSFDNAINDVCKLFGVIYSRYADDLTFSTKNKEVLFHLEKIIKTHTFEQFSGKITINKIKTVFSSKKHNRHVTGITITNEGKLSLGRKRKRYIKHLVHQFTEKKISNDDFVKLKGLLSFSKHIEPQFILSLKNKYGYDQIESIFKGLISD